MHAKGNNKYLKIEAYGGMVLLLSAVLGFILSNSVLQHVYYNFINFPICIKLGNLQFCKPLLFWINDGLVSIFFLLIGLEIKSLLQEQKESLSSQLSLPAAAAITGAIFPALIYAAFNNSHPINMRGWAIPTAMDTAFILGLLSLLGDKVSKELKIFIMALSIIDDILAVLVIALFYAGEISNIAVLISGSIVGILILLNQIGIKRLSVYSLLGFILWICVLGSGVHTSIAGILLAITIPSDLVDVLKRKIHPWVAFLILPLFALANTDITLQGLNLEQMISPLSLGIICGLFFGKQLGIFSIIYFMVNYSNYDLPNKTSWLQMYGISVLCGIGFTMSLFIGILAFESGGPEYNHIIKAAVVTGSLLSAIVGFLILQIGYRNNN